MKKRILLPTSFFFSVLFTVFLFGLMIGIIGISIWIFKNPDSQRVPQSENISKKHWSEAIVEVAKILDGDTIYISINEELKQKLNPQLREKLKKELKEEIFKNEEDEEEKLKEEIIKNEEEKEKVIRVRLIGIDAPENKDNSPKSFYASKSEDFVEEKINNKTIKIEWENSPKGSDFLGRLPAYVYTQDDKGNYSIFLNKLMLEEGYAELFRRANNIISHPFKEEFKICERQAQKEYKGVWNYKEKMKWQKEQGFTPSEEHNHYVIIGNHFHREWCPKVIHAKFYEKKYVQESRTEIEKNKYACEQCNP